MPEFEEKNSQPNPEHSYTPSVGTSPKNKGGRRRSGGFKSEAVPSNSKIGEIDPAEALKAEIAAPSPKIKETPKSAKITEPQKSESSQCSIASKGSCSLDTNKSKSSKSQPEKATLDSIKKVEERIAKRHAESEKNRSERKERKPKHSSSSNSRNSRTQQRARKTADGGILAAISRFFGSFFGGSSENSSTSTKGPARSSQKRRPRSKNQRHGNGNRNNDSGKRPNNRRGGQKRPRKNTSRSA